ncbi:MAG: hypothetical protein IPH00_07790 [Flavobacteriales bacterium]|nr:hypothetical protein [Flavobacteriales bacterium]
MPPLNPQRCSLTIGAYRHFGVDKPCMLLIRYLAAKLKTEIMLTIELRLNPFDASRPTITKGSVDLKPNRKAAHCS